MWARIDDCLGLLMTVINAFLMERYVFLEPGAKGKKKWALCLIGSIGTAAVIAVGYAGMGIDLLAAMLVIGLNISLGRKKHRFLGFLYVIPILGLTDGITTPVLYMLPYLCSFSETGELAYRFAIYALFALFLLLFYKKGKNWRKTFDDSMEQRRLRKWELFLLAASGVLMEVVSYRTVFQINTRLADYPAYEQDRVFADVFVNGILEFFITAIIIVMIIQGNRAAYYNRRVMDMQFHIIASMADIVESRDENTGGHTRRTAGYVETICRQLKKMNAFPDILTDRYIEDMVVAASLHDIGKIHIPDSVLNKPGRLTDEEFEIMKSHTTAGRDLLNQAKQELGEFEYLNMAIDMAEYHHEWWNGKGYPNGLSGQDIPLCARIMAVADVFDALTSERCYKEAMPLEKAFGIMEEETGTHFDPAVMEAFFAAYKDHSHTGR